MKIEQVTKLGKPSELLQAKKVNDSDMILPKLWIATEENHLIEEKIN